MFLTLHFDKSHLLFQLNCNQINWQMIWFDLNPSDWNVVSFTVQLIYYEQ